MAKFDDEMLDDWKRYLNLDEGDRLENDARSPVANAQLLTSHKPNRTNLTREPDQIFKQLETEKNNETEKLASMGKLCKTVAEDNVVGEHDELNAKMVTLMNHELIQSNSMRKSEQSFKKLEMKKDKEKESKKLASMWELRRPVAQDCLVDELDELDAEMSKKINDEYSTSFTCEMERLFQQIEMELNIETETERLASMDNLYNTEAEGYEHDELNAKMAKLMSDEYETEVMHEMDKYFEKLDMKKTNQTEFDCMGKVCKAARIDELDVKITELMNDESNAKCMAACEKKIPVKARKVFGTVIPLTYGDSYIDAYLKEDSSVVVIIHSYDSRSEKSQAMNRCFDTLALVHPLVKFCKIDILGCVTDIDHFKIEDFPVLTVYKKGCLFERLRRFPDTLHGDESNFLELESFLLENELLSDPLLN